MDGNFRYPRIAHYYAGYEIVDHQAGEWVRWRREHEQG